MQSNNNGKKLLWKHSWTVELTENNCMLLFCLFVFFTENANISVKLIMNIHIVKSKFPSQVWPRWHIFKSKNEKAPYRGRGSHTLPPPRSLRSLAKIAAPKKYILANSPIGSPHFQKRSAGPVIGYHASKLWKSGKCRKWQSIRHYSYKKVQDQSEWFWGHDDQKRLFYPINEK